MAFSLTGYQDFHARIDGIENPLAVEAAIDPAVNGGANILCVFTGTVVLGQLLDGITPLTQTSQWSRGFARILIPTAPRRWTAFPDGIPADTAFTHFAGGTVVVSLASIFNRNVASNAGWAVDGADLYPLGNQDEGLRIDAKLAVRDSDGFLYRISYQATVLGRAPRLPPIFER